MGQFCDARWNHPTVQPGTRVHTIGCTRVDMFVRRKTPLAQPSALRRRVEAILHEASTQGVSVTRPLVLTAKHGTTEGGVEQCTSAATLFRRLHARRHRKLSLEPADRTAAGASVRCFTLRTRQTLREPASLEALVNQACNL